MQGEIITGSRAVAQAIAVPENNQVFLGGQFNADLTMGEITLDSPLSNNVFLAYLRDDTWLWADEISHDNIQIYPNPFINSFRLSTCDNILNITVIDSFGHEIELDNESCRKPFGESFPLGIYFVEVLKNNGKSFVFKVLKVK